MSEKKLWQRIKKYLPGKAERVENILEPGMPDIYGDCKEGAYWIEMKAPLTVECKDPGKLLRPAQRAWIVTHLHSDGAAIFMCIECKRKILLFHASIVCNELYFILIAEYCGNLRKDNTMKEKIRYILQQRGLL